MPFIINIAQNHLKKPAIYASYRKYIIFSKKPTILLKFDMFWVQKPPKIISKNPYSMPNTNDPKSIDFLLNMGPIIRFET